jgi:hypothetical protein
MDSIYNFIGQVVFWLIILAIVIFIIEKIRILKDPTLVWIEDEKGIKYWVKMIYFNYIKYI